MGLWCERRKVDFESLTLNCLPRKSGKECSSAGGILRVAAGEWIAGFTINIGVGSVRNAELWGLFRGFSLAWRLDYRKVLIEMDSVVAITLVKDFNSSLHPLAHLITACQEVVDGMADLGHKFDIGLCTRLLLFWIGRSLRMLFGFLRHVLLMLLAGQVQAALLQWRSVVILRKQAIVLNEVLPFGLTIAAIFSQRLHACSLLLKAMPTKLAVGVAEEDHENFLLRLKSHIDRMTLLLGPPSSGKTTILLALAGELDRDLHFSGSVTYNGHGMHEFVPQRTAAYTSPHDAVASESQRAQVVTEYILRAKSREMLVGPAKALFMDEISSGLDSSTTYQVVNLIKQYVTSRKDQDQYWASRDEPHRFITDELAIPFDKAKSHPPALTTKKYGVSKTELLKACFAREFLLMKRNSFFYPFKLAQLSIMAMITMTLFLRTEMHRDSVDDGVVYTGALFFSMVVVLFNGLADLSMTVTRLPVFYKQRNLLFFPPWAYALPTWVLKIPINCVEVVIHAPFVPHSITFDDITYSIDVPQEMKNEGVPEDKLVLLKRVSGAFRPGVLTALMGVSGAGKTTLMDMFVEEVMGLVELNPLRQALVGLTIAVELVANPSIIFMDELTSGLDATAAAIVMRAVRNTVDTGRTVVCTIHQPSIDIFDAFDEGIDNVSKIRDGYNPATWMLEVTSSAKEMAMEIDFAEVYKNSELYRRNKEHIKELSTPASDSKDLHFPTQYSQPFLTQCIACLWKQHWSYWHNPLYTAIKLMFGTMFSNLGSKNPLWMSNEQSSIENELLECILPWHTPLHSVIVYATIGFEWTVAKFLIPIWWRWYYWACPMDWTLYGLATSQFGDIQDKVETGETVEEFMRQYIGFKQEFIRVVAAVVVGFTLLFALIFALSIKKLSFQRR
ncbi:pleiotropic drug resistance protein 1-like [Pyrus ussuriensis x Pyrus communis]|uniref:Pleiotropic drug resistance protein 1-like n=1 Tax=Pyrus ussuriensis x Pyrus communis TaxID=2448454 RepID=A0A5N5I9Q6_9ROSA|nr:pleiotropic drug resistance protein 1-like [Pyrus ussuriensis x Pyrus communis]